MTSYSKFIYAIVFILSVFGNFVSAEKKIAKVLILGNSITYHGKSPRLGWYGRWGMAASSEEKDYVHIIKRKLAATDPEIELSAGNIANTFEKIFWKFRDKDFFKYREFNADLIVLRVGENINDSLSNTNNLEIHITRLISYLDPSKDAKIYIVGSFWPKKYVNNHLKHLCEMKNWEYVSLGGLYADRAKNTAQGDFEDEGIQRHPSDAGMEAIADRIWTKLKLMI